MSDAAATPELLGRWDRLSTGLKMWIILSLGLLPLGVIAILASIDNAGANRAKAEVEARALLAENLQRFTLALSRNAFTMRATRDAMLETNEVEGICRRALARLDRFPNTKGRFAIYGEGPTPRCLTPGFAPPQAPPAQGQAGRAIIEPGGELLNVFLFDPSGAIEGVAEYRRATLAEIVNTPPIAGTFVAELVQGDKTMPLRALPEEQGSWAVTQYTFPGSQYRFQIRNAVAPMGFNEILVILTPVLMWLWASLVGWILVQRLLLRPLARVRGVIDGYKPGDRELDLPTLRSPAQEIGAVGLAFARVTQTVARHEAELEGAVVRQTRLVREVHHRVKNNLQVVASLLNLHSRGAISEDASAAYASIQRRVDALAVVHRNHYAELEENRGVALKPLISELAANLRATAPPRAAGMQIRLDIASVYVSQDVAVSVAFLITEIAEFGMLCGAGLISIALDADEPGGARLSVQVDSLAGDPDCDEALADRFDRIVSGLSRQLRSTLERDATQGLYSLRVAVIDMPSA